MNLVSQDAKKLRNSISGFLPNIGLSMVDYGRSAAVDRFYISCQNHRDYYKDFTGRALRVAEFERPQRQYQSRPTPTDVYVWQPIQFMVERRPVTYPITVQRRGRPLGDGPEIKIAGQYDMNSCIKYKR